VEIPGALIDACLRVSKQCGLCGKKDYPLTNLLIHYAPSTRDLTFPSPPPPPSPDLTELLTATLEQRQLVVNQDDAGVFTSRRHHPDAVVVAPIIQEPRKEDLLANYAVLSKEVLKRFPTDADICLYVGGKYFALHRVGE